MKKYRNIANCLVILLLQLVSLPLSGLAVSSGSFSSKGIVHHPFKNRQDATKKKRTENMHSRTAGGSSSTTATPAAATAAVSDTTRGGSTSTEEPTEKMSRLTKIRKAVFPIYGKKEVTKFLLIGSIKFWIILALTLTRDTKDTLVVTQCGAEAIAFLKVSVIERKR